MRYFFVGSFFTELQNVGSSARCLTPKNSGCYFKTSRRRNEGGGGDFMLFCLAILPKWTRQEQWVVAILRRATARVKVVEGILCLTHTTLFLIVLASATIHRTHKGLRKVRIWGSRTLMYEKSAGLFCPHCLVHFCIFCKTRKIVDCKFGRTFLPTALAHHKSACTEEKPMAR